MIGAGDGVSYFFTNDQLVASGNKFRECNANYPLVMDITNVCYYSCSVSMSKEYLAELSTALYGILTVQFIRGEMLGLED